MLSNPCAEVSRGSNSFNSMSTPNRSRTVFSYSTRLRRRKTTRPSADRRAPDHLRVARLAKLEADTKPTALEFNEVEGKDWPQAGVVTLTKQLKDAGLFEDEARALADVWKQEFFQAEGVTLLYRLPQEEYEKLL